jgi:hypothetical protein
MKHTTTTKETVMKAIAIVGMFLFLVAMALIENL